jgi:hypothetical protein
VPERSRATWFDTTLGVLPGYDTLGLRTVALVGAGASYPVTELAPELAQKLLLRAGGSVGAYEAELDRLHQVYGLRKDDFETQLAAICTTAQAEQRVRSAIAEEHRLRHPSLLSYELLAHLLKHRFLDAIISFNFDELLDQSIDDELGPGEYTQIVTERDWTSARVPEGPIYIKMHGTASDPGTLRFTGDNYFWTPPPLLSLVEGLLDVDHAVILNIGFRIASPDAQRLLRKPRRLSLYHLDPIELSKKTKRSIRDKRRAERLKRRGGESDTWDKVKPVSFHMRPKPRKIAPGEQSPIPATFSEQLLTRLVKQVEQCCDTEAAGPAQWRSTIRHQAAVELLSGSDTRDHPSYVRYLRRRTILEIALAAGKGRGAVSIHALVDERCGRYYELYCEAHGNGAESWSKLCHAGGLMESRDSPDTYLFMPELSEANNALKLPPGAKRDNVLHYAKPRALAEHVMRSMSPTAKKPKRSTKLLEQALTFLQTGIEIEVHSSDDRICSKVFHGAVVLPTLTALRGWTEELLKTGESFDSLKVVAETGKWLQNSPALRRRNDVLEARGESPVPIELVAAFVPVAPEGNAPVEIPGCETYYIPWWHHNRHLTILMKGSGEQARPRCAIYFVRRLRSATVTPVYVTDAEDLDRLVASFKILWDYGLREADDTER